MRKSLLRTDITVLHLCLVFVFTFSVFVVDLPTDCILSFLFPAETAVLVPVFSQSTDVVVVNFVVVLKFPIFLATWDLAPLSQHHCIKDNLPMKIYPYLSYRREINETDVNCTCNLQKIWDSSDSLNGNSCSLVKAKLITCSCSKFLCTSRSLSS